MQRHDAATAVMISQAFRDHSHRVLLSYKDDRKAVKKYVLLYCLNTQNVSNNDYSSWNADLPNFTT